MAGHEPPSAPPSGYVWIDEQRIARLESAVDRLTFGQGQANADKLTTRGRFFTAFAKIDALELVTTATAKKVDRVLEVVEAIAKRFTVEAP